MFLAGKIFDTMKGWKSIDSLAEMLMKFLSFHTASVVSTNSTQVKAVTRNAWQSSDCLEVWSGLP